jgi:hypothetical protein
MSCDALRSPIWETIGADPKGLAAYLLFTDAGSVNWAPRPLGTLKGT